MANGAVFQAIYVGNFADLEAPAGTTGAYVDTGDAPGTSSGGSEPNASLLFGQTVSGSDLALVQISANEVTTNNGVIGTDDYGGSFSTQGTYADQANYVRGDTIEYTVPGGASYGDGTGNFGDTSEGVAVDSVHWYNITVTHLVGGVETDTTKLVVVFQTDVGDVFIQEYADSNSGIYNLDNMVIQSITFNSSNGSGPNDIRDNWTVENTTFVCFANGTRIATKHGTLNVEALRVGDLVQTLDHGLQKVRWIGSRFIDGKTLNENPKLRPVRIKSGQLGNGLPEGDLIVSRQHRMLVASKISERMFRGGQVLVPAIKLIGLPGIEIAEDVECVEYFHILLDNHEVIFANGAPAESLYTGPHALASLSPGALDEILTLFPELNTAAIFTDLIRPVPNSGKQAAKLVFRHSENNRPLLEKYQAIETLRPV